MKEKIKSSLLLLARLYDRTVGVKKDVFIFNCKHGLKDNPWHLMLYYLEKGEKCLWVANSESERLKVVEALGSNFTSLYTYTRSDIRNELLNLKVKFYFVSHNFLDFGLKKKNAPIINLWHGIPFKKMGFDSVLDIEKYELDHKKGSRYQNDFIVSSYDGAAANIATALGVPVERALGLGQPRNDILFVEQEKGQNLKSCLCILYAPTFRDKSGSTAHIDDVLTAFSELQSDLFTLVLRLHPNDKAYSCNIQLPKNVVLSTEDDPQIDLLRTDLLITDYSSIVFDYAIMRRPIILYVPDKEDYLDNRGGSYYRFDDIFYKVRTCVSKTQLMDALEKVSNQPQSYPKLEALNPVVNSCSSIYRRFS